MISTTAADQAATHHALSMLGGVLLLLCAAGYLALAAHHVAHPARARRHKRRTHKKHAVHSERTGPEALSLTQRFWRPEVTRLVVQAAVVLVIGIKILTSG